MEERKEINIYLDESSIDNPQNPYMVTGALFINRKKISDIRAVVSGIKETHGFLGEIKWTKTDKKKSEFLKELVDYLVKLPSEDLSFNCIVAKKDCIDYEKYHKDDKELAFYKFIYILLSHRIRNGFNYYIFPDFKPNKLKERVKNLGEFLDKYIYFYKNNSSIKHIQSYDSKENLFIQLADFFIGAVGYHFNNIDNGSGSAKDIMACYIAESIGKDRLNINSSNKESKFNVWNIKLD
jgi:hypothetical protein